MQTLNCNQSLIDLSIPKVMGIINVTPDSFYDGGTTIQNSEIVAQATQMLNEGASILDIGGYSSRPGAAEVSVHQELERVIPGIEAILATFPSAILSIDTFRSEVAEAAIRAGAAMVNDISAGNLDKAMYATVAKLQVPYIMMHMRGTPEDMQQRTQYENVTTEVIKELSERLRAARQAGINDVVVDPGFGFAKTTAQNFELLNHLELFDALDAPYLIGISRKSMIYKTLGIDAPQALNGTSTLHAIALQKGASILRVHDVKEAVECEKLHEALTRY